MALKNRKDQQSHCYHWRWGCCFTITKPNKKIHTQCIKPRKDLHKFSAASCASKNKSDENEETAMTSRKYTNKIFTWPQVKGTKLASIKEAQNQDDKFVSKKQVKMMLSLKS